MDRDMPERASVPVPAQAGRARIFGINDLPSGDDKQDNTSKDGSQTAVTNDPI